MPDSPADVRAQSRSTPPPMPLPPPTITQGPARNASFTPATKMNGNSHSLTAISRASSTPNGFSNGPATSTTASLTNQQLPPACGARQLCKLKRFLTALQQFANDLSPEIGERVRSLVLGLVNSTWTIEDFHSKLQEATNFPLRPFVIPFLKANLPLLQRELLYCARLAKQTPAQYLAQHEQLLLDANCTSSIDSSEILLEVNENGKRKTPDRTKENGLTSDPLHAEHLSKRPFTLSPGQCFSPSNGLNHQPNGLPHQAPPPPQHYRLEDMAVAHHYRDAYRHLEHRDLRDRHGPAAPGVHGSRQEAVIDHRLTDREWAEEWKHLDNLLNCIMDMVEKTRRSLTVLRRCQEADRNELNHWIRRYSDTDDIGKGGNSMQPPQNSSSLEGPQLEIDGAILQRQGYTREEIWKKAEEAVNEVKRQAMMELKKAVLEAECKAHEMITAERAKMERALSEAKRQASEDARSTINKQEDSNEASRIHTASWSREDEADGPADITTMARATPCSSDRRRTPGGARQMASVTPPSESCWNCGRKASETCSGCNTARYCGSFCQHKDWEKHHHVCRQNFQGLQVSSIATNSSSGSQNTATSSLSGSQNTATSSLSGSQNTATSSLSGSQNTATSSLSGSSSSQAQPDAIASSGAQSPRDTGSTTASSSVTPPTPIPVETATH
ncbi:protein CBFA2T3-like isoform X2 [Carcharodon carcharias]|uniref:protein CBFA2T3-like isoform X2 n=1 Tax=Carcharodon carcharias TaxID=13397 RepID=UPI001B7EF06E|nr:protein CBFA2T3-like isoform X2 [Carcharodon carcharias]